MQERRDGRTARWTNRACEEDVLVHLRQEGRITLAGAVRTLMARSLDVTCKDDALQGSARWHEYCSIQVQSIFPGEAKGMV